MLGTESGWNCLFANAEQLLEVIQKDQADLETWQEDQEAAVLRKEELQGALKETGARRKHAKHARGPEQPSKEDLEHELQASLLSEQPAGQARPPT